VPRQSRFGAAVAEGDPFRLVALVPLGSRLRTQVVNGARYWFARTPARPGLDAGERIYVGSDANKATLEAAWATVQAAIREAEATPDGRRLRELQELAGGPSLARTSASEVVDIPILGSVGSGRGGAQRPKR